MTYIEQIKYGNNAVLHKYAKIDLLLQDLVKWSDNEYSQKIWGQDKTKVLATCFEAIIGAIYLDQGIEEVESFLQAIDFYHSIDNLP